jgi:alpha-beta hydrolase superfamily lysophospholipase
MLRLRFFQRLGLLAPMLRLHGAIETWAQNTPAPYGTVAQRVRPAGPVD